MDLDKLAELLSANLTALQTILTEITSAKADETELQFLRDERSQYWPLLNDLKQFNRDKQYTAGYAAKVKEDLAKIDDYEKCKEKAEKYDRIQEKLREIYDED